MNKILLIEDNIDLSNQIKTYLERYNYDIDIASNIEDAISLIENKYDIALLDINLPDGSGIILLEKLKFHSIKTIITTVKDEEDFIVNALDKGADDYITKPFSLAVLRARIDVILRDIVSINNSKIEYRDFTLDKDNLKIIYKDKIVDLTVKEFEILSVFIENPHRIFTRENLLEIFWDTNENYVNDNTLTVTIKRIREKTDKSIIKTIRGIGYRMD